MQGGRYAYVIGPCAAGLPGRTAPAVLGRTWTQARRGDLPPLSWLRCQTGSGRTRRGSHAVVALLRVGQKLPAVPCPSVPSRAPCTIGPFASPSSARRVLRTYLDAAYICNVQMHRHLSDDPAPRSSNNCVPSEVRTRPRSPSRLLPWTFSTYPDCCCTPNILYVTRVEALPRKSHFLPPRDAQRRTPAPQRSRGVDVGMVTTRNVSLCAHNVQGPAAGPYSVRASKFALGERSSGCGSSCIMRESRPCTIAVGVRRCARRRTGDPGMQGSGVESVSLSMQVSPVMHDNTFS